MLELQQRESDCKDWLLTFGIDIDEIAHRAYDAVRNDRFLGFPPGPDSVIASQGWCETTTFFITRELQSLLGMNKAELCAYAEMHTARGLSHPEVLSTTNDDHILHWYTAIVRRENRGLTAADVVLDAAYKQFLRREVRQGYPDVFVGERHAIAAIMERDGLRPNVSEIYGVDSFDLHQSEARGRGWGLAVRDAGAANPLMARPDELVRAVGSQSLQTLANGPVSALIHP